MAKAAKEKASPKFGGYTVSFKDDETSLEKLFGDKPLSPAEMTKKLWDHVKANKK